MSVIGYDNTSASRPPGVALTTIDIHADALGRQAAEAALLRLVDRDAAPMEFKISPSLVVRHTTAPPPA